MDETGKSFGDIKILAHLLSAFEEGASPRTIKRLQAWEKEMCEKINEGDPVVGPGPDHPDGPRSPAGVDNEETT